MFIAIIIAKLGIVGVYLSVLMMIYQFRKQEPSMKLGFDTFSMLEISLGVGIALVGLISVITPKTYTFTFILCLVSIGLGLLHRYRILLVGNDKVLLGSKVYRVRNISKLETGMFTLKVFMKDQTKPISIYAPLTSNKVLKEKVQAKLKKHKK